MLKHISTKVIDETEESMEYGTRFQRKGIILQDTILMNCEPSGRAWGGLTGLFRRFQGSNLSSEG